MIKIYSKTRSCLRLLLTLLIVLPIAGILMIPAPASAQYFGRNKVNYDSFDFKSFKTDHFEFYVYPEEELAVKDASRMGERWYQRHSRTFLRQFFERKPVIFYANDADFQQTNAVGGTLGQGIGGVTESLKERVIMPLTGSYKETDHVLGHELVHSFQYDIALSRADSNRFALQLLPGWLIEGMAEYLSVGRDDPHTAMWMRDAAIRDDLPTIRQITTDQSYFPYRYGQAYLAYVGGKYGDAAVANLFKLGGRIGLDSAFVYTLGITADSLSTEWIAAVKASYLPLVEGRTPVEEAGRKVLAEDIDSGNLNISPVVSPDGQYVAFLSEKDLFTMNLFIADANTGEVLKTLKGTFRDSHFDAIRFISSAGSWSPDGQRFAFITFVEGDNEIAILDWNTGIIEERISVAGVSAIVNPAWSPDGRTLAFTGLDGGISDIYLLDLRTKTVTQLTDDRYADLQPAWSPDGRTLAFVSDRGPDGTNFETLRYADERLVVMDTETLEFEVFKPFNGRHMNPQFSPDGRNLYFISDYDGFKDIYRMELDSEDVYKITNLQTGVSGITAMSPAMSVAAQSGRMMFSVYSDGEYTVFSKEPSELEGTLMEAYDPDKTYTAGILPPMRALDEGLVGNYLNDPRTGLPPDQDYTLSEYSSGLQLDYVAPPSIGVSAGGPYGGGLQGGVALYFSDMLGNHNLGVVVQANGTFKDIGGQVQYLNRGHRFNYGGSVGHIPILFGGYLAPTIDTDPETGALSEVFGQIRQRIYIDQVSGIASYPFTTTRRLELGLGFTRYGFDYEVDRFYVNQFGVRRERTNLNELEPDPVYYGSASLALISDYSFFAFTSPVRGGRSRLEVTPFYGTQKYVRLLADLRRYIFLKPFTFAIRGLHVGNYGVSNNDDNQLFTSEYLGYSNGRSYIRGYGFSTFDGRDCLATIEECRAEQDRLIGSRVVMASAELRLPLLGNSAFGLIEFPYLPTELTFFFDGGVTWTKDDLPVLEFNTKPTTDRIPVFSAGVSTRFNLFGYTVLEIFYAKPFQRPGKGALFGFQIVPGW
ncbi:MAG: basic secretory protein-like protein [Rhodothermia bacterium]|nr:MAG: basic secretory protein-like protein [Rhodothermia bacterium]